MRLTTALVATTSLLAWTSCASPAGEDSLCEAIATWTSSSGVAHTISCDSLKDKCAGPVAQARTASGCSAGTSLTFFSTSKCGTEAENGQAKANSFALSLQNQGFTCIPKATAYSSTTKASTTAMATSSTTSALACKASAYYTSDYSNSYYTFCTSTDTKCGDAVPQARTASGCTRYQDTDSTSISNCGAERNGGEDKRNTFALSLQSRGFVCDPPGEATSSTTTTMMKMTTSTSKKTTTTTMMTTKTTTKATTKTTTTSRAATTSKAGLVGGILGDVFGLAEGIVDGTGL